jgi:two-component system OmpR family sensor kinase
VSVVRLFAAIPIRMRLTLAFAAVMALVLAGAGLFLYLRLGADLDRSIDRRLRERAGDVGALVHRGDPRLGARAQGLAQVVDAEGSVLDATRGLERPLLSRAEISGATHAPLQVRSRAVPGSDEPARLLATPIATAAGRLVVVVGASLEERGDALESLLLALLIGGPLALVLSSLAAYGLAAAALRPVESMRREAESISAAEPGRRLPLPPARDEIHDLGQTLNSMLGRLESALERERRFVSDASHELRTPLAALRTELELALRRERTPEELEDALRSAAEETERLAQLADDLLVLARSEDGRLPVRRELLAVDELLADVQRRYERRAAVAHRPLELRVEDGLELSIDRLRTEQALGNLVENALRHGRGRIRIEAHRTDGRVELHVLDEGPGFAPEFIAHAFEPFSRGDGARSGAGAGLGLAIVDVVARAHGGAAHATNVEGGTDVWLELPQFLDSGGAVSAGSARGARRRAVER